MLPRALNSLLLVIVLGFVSLGLPAFALDTKKLQPTGYVNDFANVIDPANKQAITEYCGNLERIAGVQFAVVTVESLEDDPIEDVANRLYSEWGVGKKGKDEGLLLMLSIKDRKQRAEVGYGLEGIINDAAAGDVLRGMRPILRQGNYGDALYSAVRQFGDRVVRAKGITDELLTPAAPQRGSRDGSGGSIVPLLVFAVVMLFLFAGRGGGGRGIGGGGGGIGNLLTGMLLGNLLSGGGRRGGNWGGGGFGGYDGGGGGGGGFGGFGGGSSGGGGASGDW